MPCISLAASNLTWIEGLPGRSTHSCHPSLNLVTSIIGNRRTCRSIWYISKHTLLKLLFLKDRPYWRGHWSSVCDWIADISKIPFLHMASLVRFSRWNWCTFKLIGSSFDWIFVCFLHEKQTQWAACVENTAPGVFLYTIFSDFRLVKNKWDVLSRVIS